MQHGGQGQQYSLLELKHDICGALELNESCYTTLTQASSDKNNIPSRDSQQKCLEEHINMVCGIRARLMQALQKSTNFLESNIELLATIASLKREASTFREEQHQSTQVLNGRISCLLEIVREQQESLDRKQETLALKGVWSNLLNVSPDGNVRHPSQKKDNKRGGGEEKETGKGGGDEGELDEYAANVLTWLSLQCAQEASRWSHTTAGHRQQMQQDIYPHIHERGKPSSTSSSSSLSKDIDDQLGSISSVTELVQKVRGLFHSLDAMTQSTEKENSTMRVKLQEMSAICTALRRERDEKEGEIERWKDAISVLQTDHDYASNQVALLTQENKKLVVSNQAERASAEDWRTKCHEILEAVEKNSELTTLHGNSSTRYSITPPLSSSLNSSLRTIPNLTAAHSSPSTFYSHQQYLFSPPHAEQCSYRNHCDFQHNLSTALPCSLDAYCPLVEQAELVTQSPPTPFATDNQHRQSPSLKDQLKHVCAQSDTHRHSREGGNTCSTGVDQVGETEIETVEVTETESKTGVSQADVTVSSDTHHKNAGCELSPPIKRVSSPGPKSKAGPKTIEPMDPRLLDDSTLYKMLLEAEEEIGELRSSDDQSDKKCANSNGDSDKLHCHENDSKRRSPFRNSIDLQSAIAHGQQLMNYNKHIVNENSPPKSNIINSPPTSFNSHTSMHPHTPTQFQSSSYKTPNKLKPPSSSKQFTQSVHLKNISATKSPSKEWNQYFTRGDRARREGDTAQESPYDIVLRRFREEGQVHQQHSLLTASSSSTNTGTGKNNLVPISPIPLSQGQ